MHECQHTPSIKNQQGVAACPLTKAVANHGCCKTLMLPPSTEMRQSPKWLTKLGLQGSESVKQNGGAFCAICRLDLWYGTGVGGQVGLLHGGALLLHLLYIFHIVAWRYLHRSRISDTSWLVNALAVE